MLIEKHNSIRMRDLSQPTGGSQAPDELQQGMVRVNHLYRSALKMAVAQLEILDEEFETMYAHVY